MIIAELPTGKTAITFEHQEIDLISPSATSPDDIVELTTQHRTICKLLNAEVHPMVCLGQGVANCHEKDQFCKAIGRKLALTRALKSASLGKRSREVIWNAYLRRNVPIEPKAQDGVGNV